MKTKHDIINIASPHHWYVPLEILEDPDENDPLEIHPESLPYPEEANRGFDRTEYDRLLAEETRLMEERRKKLKERSG